MEVKLYEYIEKKKLEKLLECLYSCLELPLQALSENGQTLCGFGISTPGHVRRALEAGAAGVIMGSALVKIVSEHLGDRDAMLKALGSAAASFKAATRTA